MSLWAPGAVALALALGSPIDPAAPSDYRFSLESDWSGVAAQGLVERRDGAMLWGYDLSAAKGVGRGWRASGEDRRMIGRGINRQTALATHGIYRGLAAGGGLAAHHYQRPHGAVALHLPLPGGGLDYITDFERVHVTDAEATLH